MIKQCDSIIIPTDYVVCEVANPTLMEKIEKERKAEEVTMHLLFWFQKGGWGFRILHGSMVLEQTKKEAL
jgi:hypothetical protein